MISHWTTDTARYSAMRRLAAGVMHKVRLSGLHLQEEQAALVGYRLRRLQAPPPGTEGAKPESREGLPAQQTRAISARLDGLLRHTPSNTDRFQNWPNGLRRRVRLCYWKQWRQTRTKINHFLALGVDKWSAIVTGVSGKSDWHLSRSKATQVGMTNDWLRRQGLVSIRDLWMKAHR